MSTPRRILGIYDTVEGVVHVDDFYNLGSDWLTNTNEFVAWLNARVKADPDAPRFVVVTATLIVRSRALARPASTRPTSRASRKTRWAS
jgi:hypothetical protein